MKYGKTPTIDSTMLFSMKDDEQLHELIRKYMKIYDFFPESNIVKYHKQLLGKQDQVWVGGSENRKFYIWYIEDMFVLVHNVKGILFEVDQGTTFERFLEMFEIYCNKMQILNF